MRHWLLGLVMLVGAAMVAPADASIILLNAQPAGSWSLETRASGFTFDRLEVTSVTPSDNLESPYLDTFAYANSINGTYSEATTWSLDSASAGFASASGDLIGGGDPNRNAFSWMTYFGNDIENLSQWRITFYDGVEIELDGIATWEDGLWSFGGVGPADPIPEPSTFIIWSCLALGGMGLNVWRRRKSPLGQVADRVGNVAWSDDTRKSVRAIIDRGRVG